MRSRCCHIRSHTHRSHVLVFEASRHSLGRMYGMLFRSAEAVQFIHVRTLKQLYVSLSFLCVRGSSFGM